MLTNFVNTYKRKLMIGNIGDGCLGGPNQVASKLEKPADDPELALSIEQIRNQK